MIVPARQLLMKQSPYQVIRKVPHDHTLYIKVGKLVAPETLVATGWKRAGFRTFDLAKAFSVKPEEAGALMIRAVGSNVLQGDVIAKKKDVFGLRERVFKSPASGVLADYNEKSGRITLQYQPSEVKVVSGVKGKVLKIDKEKGVVIGTQVDVVRVPVMFGLSREGALEEVGYRDLPLQVDQITEAHKGKIIFGGTRVSLDVMYKALSVGVNAIITGGIDYASYVDLVGSKGKDEDVGVSVLCTEGFGASPIHESQYDILSGSKSRYVMVDSALHGVVIPLPLDDKYLQDVMLDDSLDKSDLLKFIELKEGMSVRLLVGENFGKYGVVKGFIDNEVQVDIAGSVITVEPGILEAVLG